LIFCVGACIKNNVKILGEIAQILWENWINIELVSQGRLQRAIVLWISQDYFEKAVNLLHEKLICNR
jgi:aspartokinase